MADDTSGVGSISDLVRSESNSGFMRTKGSSGTSVVTEPTDELAQEAMNHRHHLETLDTKIANLDRTIEIEQERLSEAKAALESSYQSRSKLIHLRTAMLQFVLDLESRRME